MLVIVIWAKVYDYAMNTKSFYFGIWQYVRLCIKNFRKIKSDDFSSYKT